MITPDLSTPRIWLLLSDKLGDNAQVEIIAEALGLPYEIRRVYPLEQYVLGKPPFRPSLYHLDRERSDPLAPPWPDLIITIGRRPAMAAMWVRQQSGGRTKVVLLGRPKRMLEQYALVIATAQYCLPERPNVLHLDLPLMRGNEAAIAAATQRWQARLAGLPRPLTALLVGGPTKPFVFDAGVARELARQALAAAEGGTLYVTTSRRTPAPVVQALEEALSGRARFYRWGDAPEDNPYQALLGLADRFIVTGDSISMMVEVARLGKPLAIFALPRQQGPLAGLRQGLANLLHPPAGGEGRGGALRIVGDLLYRVGLVSYSRDLTALHRLLMEKGLAVPLGEPFPAGGAKVPDELPQVVARIRALLK
ncbi:MAG: mitochondrial fission ELM1 family protein [Gammaproteobacteria bacterium]